MFCMKCGQSIPDEAVFCPVCGASCAAVPAVKNTAAAPSVNEAQETRARSMTELNRMVQYFAPDEARYQRLEVLLKQAKEMSHTGKVPLLVWGCIILTFGLFITVAIVVSISDARGSDANAGSSSAGLFFGLFFLVGGLLMVAGFIVSNVNRSRKYPLVVEEIAGLSTELTEHFLDYGLCETGMEYTRAGVLQQLQSLVYNGRAYTIKEAINLMLADRQQQEMLQYARATAEYTQRAAEYAHSAAKGAAVGAAFSAANFFLK